MKDSTLLLLFKRIDLQTKLLFGDGHPFPGDDDSLDLSCSLVDLIDLGVPHQLLRGVLGVEPVSTKDLDSIGSRLNNNYLLFVIRYK